jgi:tagatose-6-phosphate ketose/aldose isomerase
MAEAGAGSITRAEIFQQPALWPVTAAEFLAATRQFDLAARLGPGRVLFTGAGTSAYAASAAAAVSPRAFAISTTDLLVDAERHLEGVTAVVSLARSGQSPESAAVVETVRRLRPEIFQLAITCNPDSALTRASIDRALLLDPRANDQSLVMTSSFSNLVLAGQCLLDPQAASAAVKAVADRGRSLLPAIDRACQSVAERVQDRMVVLASSPLQGWALEARLKALEMTAGAYAVMAESYLGLRHGPMSFVREDTLVLCLIANDPLRRLYELDLLRELRAKNIGYLVGIAAEDIAQNLFDAMIPAVAPSLADALRAPYEIMAAQLLGYHLSRARGLDPDNPSPGGVINRVVQGVVIHSGRAGS